MIWHDKCQLRIACHEEEYDERIGECDKKSRNAVLHQRAPSVVAYVYLLCRIAAVAVYSECHQHYAAADLQYELVVPLVYNVHYERHAETCYQGVEDIADTCPDTGDKPVPASLVQRSLYAENADRSHRGRGNDAYKYALEYQVKNIYMDRKCHSGCKVPVFLPNIQILTAKLCLLQLN